MSTNVQYASTVEIETGNTDSQIRAEMNDSYAENFEIFNRYKGVGVGLGGSLDFLEQIGHRCYEVWLEEAQNAYDAYVDCEMVAYKERDLD